MKATGAKIRILSAPGTPSLTGHRHPDGRLTLLSYGKVVVEFSAFETDCLRRLLHGGLMTPVPKHYEPFAAEAFRRREAGEIPKAVEIGLALGWSKRRAAAASAAMKERGLWTWDARSGAKGPRATGDLGVCVDCRKPIRRTPGGRLIRYRHPAGGWWCRICRYVEYRDKQREADIERRKEEARVIAEKNEAKRERYARAAATNKANRAKESRKAERLAKRAGGGT